MSGQRVIGIDFGTTNCCVGVWQSQKVEIVANDQGNRTTFSYISFKDNEKHIGDSAKGFSAANLTNTVFNLKRLIGRVLTDQNLKALKKQYPFNLEAGLNEKLMISVTSQKKLKKFYPEELLSMLILKMKRMVQDHLGQEVKNTILTVPTFFNQAQRQSILDAAQIVGINVVQLLSENVAAAIAYRMQTKLQNYKKAMVFNMGGGKIEVSIITINKEVIELNLTSGSCDLGGQDFDERLVQYCASEFQKTKSLNVRSSPRALRRIKNQIQKVKMILSTSLSATIQIDCLFEGVDFSLQISRTRFEEICDDLIRKTMFYVQKSLAISSIDKTEIKEIILVGGSTKIPKIRQLLKEYFKGLSPFCFERPEEAISAGAAIYGAMVSGTKFEQKNTLKVHDAIAYSIGIEIAGGTMHVVIPRFTKIPFKRTQIFTTYTDNQIGLKLQVYQGERLMVKDNNFLGDFTIQGLQPAPKGIPQIEATFSLDLNGILSLSAKLDKKNQKQQSKSSLTVKSNIKGILLRTQKQKLIDNLKRANQQSKASQVEKGCLQYK